MKPEPQKVRSIFLAAVERAAAERAEYLDHACAETEVRRRVEVLLKAHEQANSLLDQPPALHPHAVSSVAPFDVTVNELAVERPGTMVGAYKLLEQIGEGGFGIVFMAEQTEPVRRKVALKILKPGMDTRQVVARFEAERQALAIMDHPNIAKVFDGGTSPSGRPYVVMELVRGVPITEYCDQRHLTPRQRLELFIPVCQAVQHAHHKGIIHRDLKPSNVLVTMNETMPVPKVIDFGIAKALGQELTDKTLFTGFAQMIGTPLYMSPEQAGQSGLDVDTRTDIYSLGVLLYELLTGTTPFDKERFKQAAFDEICRIIREEEPPKPSTRLSELGSKQTPFDVTNGRRCEPATLASVSVQRQTEPAKLTKQVRGELDWIVMKALEKDRNRRYETATGFAMDVQRYLADEPVLACPPSAVYRARKFLQRNRIAVAFAGVVILLLGFSVAIFGWMLRDREAREAEIARDQAAQRTRLEQRVATVLEETEAAFNRNRLPDAKSAVRRAMDLLASGDANGELQQRVQRWRLDLELSDRLDDIRLHPLDREKNEPEWESQACRYRLVLRDYDIDPTAADLHAVAKRIRGSSIRSRLLAALDDWLYCTVNTSDPDSSKLLALLQRVDADPWRKQLRDAVVGRDGVALAKLAADDAVLSQRPATICLLGILLAETNQRLRAVEMLGRAQRSYADDFWINHSIGLHLQRFGPRRSADAIGFFRVAVAARPEDPFVRNELGYCFWQLKQLAEAEAEFRAAIGLKSDFALFHVNLGTVLAEQGRPDDADASLARALSISPDNYLANYNMANSLMRKGDKDGAIAALQRATAANPKYAKAHYNLAALLRGRGDTEEAIVCYRRAIEANPKFAEAHVNLGIILRNRGLLREAVDVLQEALRLKPDLVPARNGLNLAARRLTDSADPTERDPEKARALAQRLVDLSPENGPYWNTLGMAYYRLGRWKEALEALGKSMELRKGGDAHDWFFVALAHGQLGDQKQARVWYDRAVQWRKRHAAQEEHLQRYQAEAAALLKIYE